MQTKPKIKIDPKEVEKYAAVGMSLEQIASALGIGVVTLYARKRELVEIEEAIKRGRAKGHAVISNKLFELAKNGNVGAICFYLKCKCGWKEDQLQTVVNVSQQATAESTSNIDISKLSPKERDEFIIKAFAHR